MSTGIMRWIIELGNTTSNQVFEIKDSKKYSRRYMDERQDLLANFFSTSMYVGLKSNFGTHWANIIKTGLILMRSRRTNHMN